MSNPELLNRLRDLHEELADINEEIKSTQQIDDETASALGEIVKDVGNLVDQTREASPSTAEDHNEHSELHDRIIKFEADHPQVTSFLTQISELLAMMGI